MTKLSPIESFCVAHLLVIVSTPKLTLCNGVFLRWKIYCKAIRPTILTKFTLLIVNPKPNNIILVSFIVSTSILNNLHKKKMSTQILGIAATHTHLTAPKCPESESLASIMGGKKFSRKSHITRSRTKRNKVKKSQLQSPFPPEVCIKDFSIPSIRHPHTKHYKYKPKKDRVSEKPPAPIPIPIIFFESGPPTHKRLVVVLMFAASPAFGRRQTSAATITN